MTDLLIKFNIDTGVVSIKENGANAEGVALYVVGPIISERISSWGPKAGTTSKKRRTI
jgi:hypothetical protein